MNPNIKFYKCLINKYYTNKIELDDEYISNNNSDDNEDDDNNGNDNEDDDNNGNDNEDDDDDDNEDDDDEEEDDDDDEHRFRKIMGYLNYSVSNTGNVCNDKFNGILKPGNNGRGYHVNLNKHNKGGNHLVHRLVAIAFLANPDEKEMVDHIDGVETNNSVINLRWCSIKENLQNQGKRSNNTPSFKGVTYSKHAKKYKARIMIDGKTKHLAYFKTVEDDSKVYEEAAKKYFGEIFRKPK